MIRSYLSIAGRNLIRQGRYSCINVVGLTIGLACFMVIALFVYHELSYDTQWTSSDRIYRVSRDAFSADGRTEFHFAPIASQAAALLKEDFPQVEKAGRLLCCGILLQREDGTQFVESRFAEADPELLEIFDFHWLRGDPDTALSEPFALVLTESAASKYFGDADPIGRTLLASFGGAQSARVVTGVIEDLPKSTHLSFDMVGSMLARESGPAADSRFDNWQANAFHTYVLLKSSRDAAEIQRQSGPFFERHVRKGASKSAGYTLTPVADIHLRTHREGELKPTGSLATVYAFAAIATFVLLIACINFTNLATARSADRAKEIGVRKFLGAQRAQVAGRFLIESVLVAVVAVLLAASLVELALPLFNRYLDSSLELDGIGPTKVFAGLALLALATGLIAGAWPAVFLSALQPIDALRSGSKGPGGPRKLRQTLVALQFSISITLLIATAVVYEQTRYARNIELGFDRTGLVYVSPASVGGEQWETLKRQWLANPNVIAVTASDSPPFRPNRATTYVGRDGTSLDSAAQMQALRVDYGFFETYDVEVIAGRTFAESLGTDRLTAKADDTGRYAGAFVLNELAARALGWTPEESIGQYLQEATENSRGPVIGVVRNIHFESLRSEIAPTIYWVPHSPLRSITLKLSGRELGDTLRYIDETWGRLVPNIPIARQFLDQDFEALYRAEARLGTMFASFSVLAIAVACLGMIGLVAYAAERRAKEVAIRKAIGGGVQDIVWLFTSEFVLLALVANVVAWPAAYISMRRWLTGFAYRIDLDPWVFLASAALTLTIALVTVGSIATWIANTKPAVALRHE
jgi:putative ABC transport system permease protein